MHKLTTAAVAAAILLTAGGQAMEGGRRSQFTVEHVREESPRPFEAATAAFEAKLGRHDPAPAAELARGASPRSVREAIERMAGPSGFMLFGKHNHGSLLALVGPPRRASQYIVGNPLFAVEMTRHDIGAALYAPLRVLIYEREGGGTVIEYDLPSSQFGRLGNPKVDEIAAGLDRKLAALVADALR